MTDRRTRLGYVLDGLVEAVEDDAAALTPTERRMLVMAKWLVERVMKALYGGFQA